MPCDVMERTQDKPNHMWIPVKDLQFIEFYSGRARATLCMKAAGLRAARLDYIYFNGEGNNYYNILTDGGFAFLGKEILANPSKPNSATLFNMLYVHLAWVHGLTCHIRLCIATMLRARAGECVILLGMKCSSWTVVNQGTSRRAPCCPSGDTTKASVKMANCMAARKLSFINLIFLLSKQLNQKWFQRVVKTLSPHVPQLSKDDIAMFTCLGHKQRVPFGATVPNTAALVWKVSAHSKCQPCFLTIYFLTWSWYRRILECDKMCSLVWLSWKEQLKTSILLNLRSTKQHGGCITTGLAAQSATWFSVTLLMLQNFHLDAYWGGMLPWTKGKNPAGPTRVKMGRNDSMAHAIWNVLRSWSQCLGPMGYTFKLVECFSFILFYGALDRGGNQSLGW